MDRGDREEQSSVQDFTEWKGDVYFKNLLSDLNSLTVSQLHTDKHQGMCVAVVWPGSPV